MVKMKLSKLMKVGKMISKRMKVVPKTPEKKISSDQKNSTKEKSCSASAQRTDATEIPATIVLHPRFL
jgi:hypothetical protein